MKLKTKQILSYLLQQITYVLGVIIVLIILCVICTNHKHNNNTNNTSNDSRNYEYEKYCDSIYQVNVDYYLDVIVESDTFQEYINKHGEWWK